MGSFDVSTNWNPLKLQMNQYFTDICVQKYAGVDILVDLYCYKVFGSNQAVEDIICLPVAINIYSKEMS